jgi:nucleotide-binding universal stress UspA family protein
MAATVSHVLVALDASARDSEVAEFAGRLATTTGVSLAIVLPRTSRVAARLSDFAASEELTPADAADAYADRMAEPLRRRGILTWSESVLADDAAAALAAFAERHGSVMILVAAEPRMLRRTVAERLVRISSTAVIVVPDQFEATAAVA